MPADPSSQPPPTYHVPDEERLDRAGIAALQRRKLAAMLERRARVQRVLPAQVRRASRSTPSADPLDKLPVHRPARSWSRTSSRTRPSARTSPTRSSTTAATTRPPAPAAAGRCGGSTRPRAGPGSRSCWGDHLPRPRAWRRATGIMFPFSFGPFVGFWAAFDGAAALGNLCIPAGGLSTQAAAADDARQRRRPSSAARRRTPCGWRKSRGRRGSTWPASKVRALIVAGEPGGSIPEVRRGSRRRGARASSTTPA